MPSTLIRRIFRGWKRHESYWDSPNGMDTNLRVIGDHLPSLNVVGLDVDPLPGSAAQCSAVLHTETGDYSVYSTKESMNGSSWTRYPASKGLLTYHDDKVYANTGFSWVDVTDSGGTVTPPTPVIPEKTIADMSRSVSTQPRKLISSPTTRTFANAVLGDVVLNPSSGFGSWINSSTFQFTKAGAYRIEAFGVLFAECVNDTLTMKRVRADAHLVIGGIAYWMGGGVSELIEPSGTESVFAAGNVSGSVSAYNIAVGDTVRIVIAANEDPGLSVFDVFFGLTGSAVEGNGASGIIITKA